MKEGVEERVARIDMFDKRTLSVFEMGRQRVDVGAGDTSGRGVSVRLMSFSMDFCGEFLEI